MIPGACLVTTVSTHCCLPLLDSSTASPSLGGIVQHAVHLLKFALPISVDLMYHHRPPSEPDEQISVPSVHAVTIVT
ncbi:hypothetical protein OUZ56_024906 [Daphnia magna]|uniref:Secreted protein n=1 Tax=Daphnia magna TaxID=35525 RepID=A0ABQ9ZIC2_9CRUS|nr:hypothetical protein OUZ56_024906 [Daphnia magna]